MRSSLVPAVIVAAMLSATACSVPTDDSAAAINPEQLPLSLRPGTTTTTTTTTVAAPLTESAIVYLLLSVPDSERRIVVQVARDVRNGTTLQGVLETIFGAEVRTEEELESGLTNALFELALLDATIDGSTAVVDIQPLDPEGLPSSEAFTGDLIGAAAQLVFTATEYEGVNGVQILISGQAVPIPTNDGDVDPLTILAREDYERFLSTDIPPLISTTTTLAEPAA